MKETRKIQWTEWTEGRYRGLGLEWKYRDEEEEVDSESPLTVHHSAALIFIFYITFLFFFSVLRVMLLIFFYEVSLEITNSSDSKKHLFIWRRLL